MTGFHNNSAISAFDILLLQGLAMCGKFRFLLYILEFHLTFCFLYEVDIEVVSLSLSAFFFYLG